PDEVKTCAFSTCLSPSVKRLRIIVIGLSDMPASLIQAERLPSYWCHISSVRSFPIALKTSVKLLEMLVGEPLWRVYCASTSSLGSLRSVWEIAQSLRSFLTRSIAASIWLSSRGVRAKAPTAESVNFPCQNAYMWMSRRLSLLTTTKASD